MSKDTKVGTNSPRFRLARTLTSLFIPHLFLSRPSRLTRIRRIGPNPLSPRPERCPLPLVSVIKLRPSILIRVLLWELLITLITIHILFRRPRIPILAPSQERHIFFDRTDDGPMRILCLHGRLVPLQEPAKSVHDVGAGAALTFNLLARTNEDSV